MIAYICKYAPAEIFSSFGEKTVLLEPDAANFNRADALMHPNICSYIKAVLEDFDPEKYKGMIFTTCCDSSRRLYDTLKKLYPDKFFYCLSLPRKLNDHSLLFYANQINEMIKAYSDFSGKEFSKEKLAEICMSRDAGKDSPSDASSINIALAGARCTSKIREMTENAGGKIILDLTCNGIKRIFPADAGDPVMRYAYALLNQLPCLRMAETTGRGRLIEQFENDLDGIIYHTVKFCDIYSFEYAGLKLTKDIPILKLETDSTSQGTGQILTRLEAFMESLRTKKGISPVSSGPAENTKGENEMYIAGIDSGSTSTNAVIINGKKEILSSTVIRTGAKSINSAERALNDALQKAGIRREDLSKIVSTGYGRVSIPFADEDITEISCHAKGAHFLNPDVRTILDIGGQDSKAIRLDEAGSVTDFVMNDKCAAGTGRFLEMMARSLEVSIEELGPLSLKAKNAAEISSMCSVFAESEVISLIAQNRDPESIALGIHHAIAGKAVSLLQRINPAPVYMMTGGVAKNSGLVKVLEEKLGSPVFIYKEPEIIGALGAAIYALESMHAGTY